MAFAGVSPDGWKLDRSGRVAGPAAEYLAVNSKPKHDKWDWNVDHCRPTLTPGKYGTHGVPGYFNVMQTLWQFQAKKLHQLSLLFAVLCFLLFRER